MALTRIRRGSLINDIQSEPVRFPKPAVHSHLEFDSLPAVTSILLPENDRVSSECFYCCLGNSRPIVAHFRYVTTTEPGLCHVRTAVFNR